MIIQLDPFIPVYSIEYKMNGYAFLAIDYSQEHHILFTVALDNGEIWTIPSIELRFQNNVSLLRKINPYVNTKKDKHK